MVFLSSTIFLMPLTKQGDELVHAVGQGGRDEAEAGCVTVDQVVISTGMLECLLEVFLSPTPTIQQCKILIICTTICPKIKYASGTLCSQSIILSRKSSTILELCSKNIMFAEHNNFKL